MTVGALATVLKFDDFQWPPGCAPEIRVGRKWVVITCVLGPTKPVRQHFSRQHVKTVWQQTAWRIQGHRKVSYVNMRKGLAEFGLDLDLCESFAQASNLWPLTWTSSEGTAALCKVWWEPPPKESRCQILFVSEMVLPALPATLSPHFLPSFLFHQTDIRRNKISMVRILLLQNKSRGALT